MFASQFCKAQMMLSLIYFFKEMFLKAQLSKLLQINFDHSLIVISAHIMLRSCKH